MKPCAAAHLSGTALLLLLGFASCGGSREAAPPPETAAASEATSASPDTAPESATSEKPPEEAAPAVDKKAKAGPAGDDDSGPETRTLDSITAIVKAHRGEARACYEKALKQIPGLKGDIVIHFVVSPEGKVKTAEVNTDRSTITNAAVSQCVIGVIRSITFPESSKGMESAVNYPFNFNP